MTTPAGRGAPNGSWQSEQIDVRAAGAVVWRAGRPRSRSCTARATTTGRSPRASSSTARPCRSRPCARSPRRPGSPCTSALRSATCATRFRTAASSCGTGRDACSRTAGSPRTRRSTSCAGSRPRGPPSMLSYVHDLDVLHRFEALGRPTSTILLVRHAQGGQPQPVERRRRRAAAVVVGTGAGGAPGHAAAAVRAGSPGERAAAALPRHDRAAGRAARHAGG